MNYSNWTKPTGKKTFSKAEPWQKENPDTRNTKMAELKPEKAKKILEDKTVHGKPLTSKQKRFMGWVAGGRKQPKGSPPGQANKANRGDPAFRGKSLAAKAEAKGKMGTR